MVRVHGVQALVMNSFAPSVYRLQAMQKMQAAAGGKGRGANGMPTPAQIQAMQVSEVS